MCICLNEGAEKCESNVQRGRRVFLEHTIVPKGGRGRRGGGGGGQNKQTWFTDQVFIFYIVVARRLPKR